MNAGVDMTSEAIARRALRLSRGLFGGYRKDGEPDRRPEASLAFSRPSGHGERVDRAL